MRVKEFIEKNPQYAGLYVSPDGRWFDAPRKGFSYKTREEILGTEPVSPEHPSEKEPAELPAQPEQSSELKGKKSKKNK